MRGPTMSPKAMRPTGPSRSSASPRRRLPIGSRHWPESRKLHSERPRQLGWNRRNSRTCLQSASPDRSSPDEEISERGRSPPPRCTTALRTPAFSSAPWVTDRKSTLQKAFSSGKGASPACYRTVRTSGRTTPAPRPGLPEDERIALP